jgi:hypothetical protein
VDKDVLARLATIEEKLDVLMRYVHPDVADSFEIRFDTVDGDERELRRALCTMPPMRGD